MVLSTMYFVADVIAVVLGFLAIFVSWHYRHRVSPPAEAGLSVDVLIPVYKEPVEMVRRTLEGALAIRYPHRTFLLDDGRRPELRVLAAELGCEYLVRQDNKHAKAGNLNNALSQTSGDFIAVFDADHIPQPHALDATLGFFSDPGVAMVQTPQDYFNIDAMQYANNQRSGALWHDQSFFYNISQPGRDHYNAASCAGTSDVYRRKAIEEIGGFPVETVTEDVHTSLRLHKAGYRTPYLDEPIAYGVAASDLSDYYRTRLRYGHGNIHVLRKENVLFCKGLTFQQRLSYLFLGLIYLEGWQQLLVFLVPSIALIFGIAPFDISIFNVLVVLLFPLWTYALMQEIGCGFSRYWTNEIFAMIRWPVHLVAATALFKDRVVWRSSSKNIKGRVDWMLLAPQIAVIVLSLGALGLGIWRLASDFSVGPLITVVADRLPSWDAITARADILLDGARDIFAQLSGTAQEATIPISEVSGGSPVAAAPAPPPLFVPPAREIDWFQPLTTGYTLDLIVVAGFWAVMNALRGIFVVIKVIANARNSRTDYAFRCLLPVELVIAGEQVQTVADRLSPTEVRLPAVILRRLLAKPDRLPCKALLHLPDETVSITIGKPAAKQAVYLPLDATSEVRARIGKCLYAVNWHREMIHHNAEFGTPLSAIGRLLGLGGMTEKPVAWQQAALLLPAASKGTSGSRNAPVVLQSTRRKGGPLELIAFRPLEAGTIVTLKTSEARSAMRHLRIMAPAEEETALSDQEGAGPRCFRYTVTDAAGQAGGRKRMRLPHPIRSETAAEPPKPRSKLPAA
jgi:cellulose synthase/poly-beta-1,6-N-acetylglucosamine synthase-like glycosyltransferase